jgi:uncharacterized protein (DUF433 family)
MAKSEPFSIRLSKPVDDLVRAEARRTKRSRSAVAEALIDEAARARMFPGIGFRGRDWARRPWVIGAGLDVWEVVAAYRDFGSVAELAAALELSERDIRLALAYYERFPEEIDEAIAENRRSIDHLRRELPFAEVVELDA